MNIEGMQAFIERQDMVSESYRHDVQRLFDELSKEHLVTLRVMLNQFAAETDGRLSSYYEGVVATTIALRFNVCGGCGRNHDDELLKDSEVVSEKVGLPAAETRAILYTPLSIEQLANMETYHLDDVRDEATGQLLGFICTLCGLRYVSIEDRMLRAPDSCHGCFLKSAHG